jgi:two-component system sensor histidine kinase VicK
LRAVAHDLRNPIGGISSLVSLMLEEDTDDEIKQQHQLIKETCVNALALINELIEAAENQNRINTIDKRADTDLIHLINNTIELLRFKAQEKQQEIELSSPEMMIMVNINPEKILRVISNLISNAIKFSHEHTKIELTVLLVNNFVQIAVADQGIGIPDAIKANVFQMFTSAKRMGTKGEKSYGLGLSISKQIIDAHGGEIWFEQGKDGGTKFYFTLPIKK